MTADIEWTSFIPCTVGDESGSVEPTLTLRESGSREARACPARTGTLTARGVDTHLVEARF